MVFYLPPLKACASQWRIMPRIVPASVPGRCTLQALRPCGTEGGLEGQRWCSLSFHKKMSGALILVLPIGNSRWSFLHNPFSLESYMRADLKLFSTLGASQYQAIHRIDLNGRTTESTASKKVLPRCLSQMSRTPVHRI